MYLISFDIEVSKFYFIVNISYSKNNGTLMTAFDLQTYMLCIL